MKPESCIGDSTDASIASDGCSLLPMARLIWKKLKKSINRDSSTSYVGVSERGTEDSAPLDWMSERASE